MNLILRLRYLGFVLGLLVAPLAAPAEAGKAERLQIGKYQSRAIWQNGHLTQGRRSPAVILIPGSGAQGPEEMMPPSLTLDRKEHSLFAEFAEPLNRAGLHTLALGKPGVEFFSTWEGSKWFYNRELYLSMRWRGYMENVVEAIRYLRARPDVDPERIYLLGHSEGTQMAVDVAAEEKELRGIILLGYAGVDIAETLDWQLFRRPIERLIKTDVDSQRRGYLLKADAEKWPELEFPWKPWQESATFAEVEAVLRADKKLQEVLTGLKGQAIYQDGVYHHGPIFEKTANLPQAIFAFTGELDVQTPSEDAVKLQMACAKVRKNNCKVEIVQGLGHGFSQPRPPRRQQFLDLTLGPVAPEFQARLHDLGKSLVK